MCGSLSCEQLWGSLTATGSSAWGGIMLLCLKHQSESIHCQRSQPDQRREEHHGQDQVGILGGIIASADRSWSCSLQNLQPVSANHQKVKSPSWDFDQVNSNCANLVWRVLVLSPWWEVPGQSRSVLVQQDWNRNQDLPAWKRLKKGNKYNKTARNKEKMYMKDKHWRLISDHNSFHNRRRKTRTVQTWRLSSSHRLEIYTDIYVVLCGIRWPLHSHRHWE